MPTVSAQAHLFGTFDFNRMPLAPMGCAVLDVSVEKTIAFLEGMKLILNAGSDIKSVVKFIGVKFS